jgi:uncharacterized protein (DUF697 family)
VPFGPGKKNDQGKGGKVAGARQLASLARGISIEEIEQAVRQPPRILFVSAEPDIDDLVSKLTGMRGMPTLEVVSPDSVPRDLGQYDVIVVHSRLSNADYLNVRKIAGVASHRVFDAGQAVDINELRTRIVEHAGNGAAALGRWYPGFRDAAATAIINETSRANAQFTLMTAVPSAIPVIGSFAMAGADMIVLTKNQLLMAIKLAAVHGKPFGDKKAILKDLMPVIGSGFVWRSLAREAVVFLPFAAGTIPRVAIAFAGTYTTGRAVDAYYRFGKKPTKTQLNDYYQQAMALVKARFAKPRAVAEPETAAPLG